MARPSLGARRKDLLDGGLFIVTAVEDHRAYKLLDERDLTGSQVILRVEVLIRPRLVHFCVGHEGVDLARGVLGCLCKRSGGESADRRDRTRRFQPVFLSRMGQYKR